MGKTDITDLLQLMEWIATSLITSQYITDFTIHDTNFIRRTNAETPFVWLVYESGTHIYSLNDIQEIRNFKEVLDVFENYRKSDFCLYKYDGNRLFPVFPKITRMWIESELTKNTNN
jgi:urate oxidase